MSFFQTDSLPTKANFLPITEQELKWNLYVTGAGFDDMRPGRSFVNEGRPELYRLEQYKNRILPEYVFIYIVDGAGEYISDLGGSLTVKKGDVFILFPGSEHQLLPDKDVGWKDIWITANGAYIHSLTQNGILDPRQPIVSSPSTAEKIAGRIERLCSQILDSPQVNSPFYAADLLGLLIEIGGCQTSSNPPDVLPRLQLSSQPLDSTQIVQNACKEIWNWGHQEIDIKLLAKKLNVNRRTLERYFNKELNRTIREEIHRCRIYRAITLLQQTNVKIEQIALMAGFPSYVHMIRVFKRMLGKTPGEFRS